MAIHCATTCNCPFPHTALGDLQPPLPRSSRSLSPDHGVLLLLQALESSSAPLSIVALAPLTNIALAIRLNPQLCRAKIERIWWMGGSAFTSGNFSAWGEANAAYDPEAADIVLRAGIPVTMYTWDVYNRVEIDQRVAQACLRRQDDKPRRALNTWTSLAARLLLRDMRHFGMPAASIGDAGAVACLIAGPRAFSTRRLNVRVELQGSHTRGMTVVDGRREVLPPDTPKLPANVDVIVDVDSDVLEELFRSTVLA